MAYRNLAFSFLFILIFISKSFAASCCSGNSNLPTLITGDYRAQIGFAFVNAASTHFVDTEGDIEKRDGSNQEIKETFNLSAAYMINPYWQVGASLPLKMNTHKNQYEKESTKGVGDIHLTTAYEFLPEYSFSYIKPRAFVFIDQSVASGKSIYEAKKIRQTDSMSNGFYTTSMGLAFIKQIKNWDALLMGEFHYGYQREFNVDPKIKIDPGNGYSSLFSVGVSPFEAPWRMGASISYGHEEGAKILTYHTEASDKDFTELGISLSYLYESYALSLHYKDQTVLPWSKNTTLDKSLILNILKLYEL